MGDVVVGIIAILIGLLFCFRGYLAMRVVIPVWGAFAGFVFGAGLVANLGREGFLASVLGWAVGAGMAVVFGLLAYLYYEVSVVMAMAGVGFAIGTSVMVAIGVTWSWLILLVGVGLGVLLGIVAIVGDMPTALLAFLTSVGGASVAVTGLMLLFGVVGLDDFDSEATTQTLNDRWWWYATYAGLAVFGLIAQMRDSVELHGSLRNSWSESGGRQLKSA